jgi:hypothetical protein
MSNAKATQAPFVYVVCYELKIGTAWHPMASAHITARSAQSHAERLERLAKSAELGYRRIHMHACPVMDT